VKALANPYDGALFHERSPWYWANNISVPTMLVESWQDEQVGSRATELTERFADGLPWRMLATNGDHGEYYGSHVLPYIDEFLSFYLAREIPARFQGGTVTEFDPPGNAKGNPSGPANGKGPQTTRAETFEEALARYQAEDKAQINFETGAGGGRTPAWIATYADWPAPETKAWRLNLSADGKLTEADAAPGTVAYNYAPVVGTQQRGGYKLVGQLPDQTKASWTETPAEGTYALFETTPFDSDKVLAGPASVDLVVSSTAADTDFQVTVTEVRPDGQEMFVQQGWLRASHRALDESQSTALRPYQTHLLEDSLPLIPGQPTPVRIEVFPFAHAFRKGSALRIYVEAPHVKPDLWGFAALPTPARNTIYTGPGLSSVALPLLEGETAQAPLPPCQIRNQPCRPTF
ncbi:MAG: CocE/NonD family hydrolase C-terminal non-catalytic domain-containing protein, partial [Actinomycetota bacterium]